MAALYSDELRRRVLAGDEPAWLKSHARRPYLLKVITATPYWVDRKAIMQIHAAARRVRLAGTHVVVDHIIPLTHHDVCGLNVPWNLRIIGYVENAKRSNRWWEFTGDLFTEPQQLCLPLVGSINTTRAEDTSATTAVAPEPAASPEECFANTLIAFHGNDTVDSAAEANGTLTDTGL